MESLIVLVVVVCLMAISGWRTERRQASLNIQADAAVRTLRGVAKKRAAAHSIPLPAPLRWETTGVHDIPSEMNAQLKATATHMTPPVGVRVSNGRNGKG